MVSGTGKHKRSYFKHKHEAEKADKNMNSQSSHPVMYYLQQVSIGPGGGGGAFF